MLSAAYPPHAQPGDQVAVLSPSSGLPAILPLPFELGLRRLTDDFGLVPVEYATTRRMGASAADRAADVHAAFADPSIAAVISSIGGDDQITVLRHLDPDLLRANPKPYFGFSDNTNLLAYLARLGIVGYHGGSVMGEFGRPGAMHPMTAESLRAALFRAGPFELRPAPGYRDIDRDWADPATFDTEPELLPGAGWSWHGSDARHERVVEGTLWGGNLEVLSWLLMADRAIGPVEEYAGSVLFVETSEELPSAIEVFRILRNMGERGLLGQFPAVLVGRPKGWSLIRRTSSDERERYRREQREAITEAIGTYAPDATVVFDLDIGHTDPQLVLPYGGRCRVNGPSRRITVEY